MPAELTKLMTLVDETNTQDYVFVESEGDVKKISRNALLPFYTQAGHVAVSSGTASITFATPFESTPRVVATYATGGSTTYANYNEIVITDITKNGFNIKLVGGYAGTFTIDWMAFAGESIPDQILADEISAVAVTLSPGTPATAAVVETADGIELQFGIPQGATGATGPQGPQGPQGDPGTGGLTTINFTGETGPSGISAKLAAICTAYDTNEPFMLQEHLDDGSYQEYMLINGKKEETSTNVFTYTLFFASHDGISDAQMSGTLLGLDLGIVKTVAPGPTYSYTYTFHRKSFTAAAASKYLPLSGGNPTGTVNFRVNSADLLVVDPHGPGEATMAMNYSYAVDRFMHRGVAHKEISAGNITGNVGIELTDRSQVPVLDVKAYKVTRTSESQGGTIVYTYSSLTPFTDFTWTCSWNGPGNKWWLFFTLNEAQAETVCFVATYTWG